MPRYEVTLVRRATQLKTVKVEAADAEQASAAAEALAVTAERDTGWCTVEECKSATFVLTLR